MRLAPSALVLALLLAGCAAPVDDRPGEPTRAEDACIATSYVADPPVVRPREGVVLTARFESCDDETIWYHSYGCPGTPIVHRVEDEAADGSVAYDARWTLGWADLSASPLPACETVMPDPKDLRAFAPGEVHKVESRWNGTLRTHLGIAPAPPGIYEVTASFATVWVTTLVEVEAS